MTRAPCRPVANCAMRQATSFASLPEFTNMQVSRCAGMRGGQALGVLENAPVQVARMRREQRGLPLDRRHHRRVGMADVRHVVVDVQVRATLGVEQPDARAAHDVQRLFVEELGTRTQRRCRRASGTGGIRRGRARIIRQGPAPALGQRLASGLVQRLQRVRRWNRRRPQAPARPVDRGGRARHAPEGSPHAAPQSA